MSLGDQNSIFKWLKVIEWAKFITLRLSVTLCVRSYNVVFGISVELCDWALKGLVNH